MGAEMKTSIELEDVAEQLVAAFQPLQQAFTRLGDAIAELLPSIGGLERLVTEVERLEAERAAQEERERQAMMAGIESWTWRVLDVIIGVTVGWWLWP